MTALHITLCVWVLRRSLLSSSSEMSSNQAMQRTAGRCAARLKAELRIMKERRSLSPAVVELVLVRCCVTSSIDSLIAAGYGVPRVEATISVPGWHLLRSRRRTSPALRLILRFLLALAGRPRAACGSRSHCGSRIPIPRSRHRDDCHFPRRHLVCGRIVHHCGRVAHETNRE